MRHQFKTACVVTLVVTTVGAGCGTSKATAPRGESTITTIMTNATQLIKTPSAIQEGLFVKPGFNVIANRSDAAVFAKILDVGPPRFNSVDGLPWGDPPRFGESTIMPTVYRIATIEITGIVFSNGVISVSVGAKLEIRALGDGSVDDGDQVIFGLASGEDGIYYDHYDAMIQPGSSVLVMLKNRENMNVYGGEKTSYVMPSPGYMGTWRVEGDMAINIDPARSAPIEELLLRILYERSLGIVPERDAGTEDNPLAGDPPPADWKPTEAETEILAPAV